MGYNLESGMFENACAIRISHALNEAGEEIAFARGITSSGAEGDWHIFRVNDLKEHLTEQFGEPDVTSSNPMDFAGRQGIIVFDVDGWSNASGHADLFNGYDCEGVCYCNGPTGAPSQAYLWEMN